MRSTKPEVPSKFPRGVKLAAKSSKKTATKSRVKPKSNRSVGILLHRIHASNDSVYEAAENLVNSRKKLFEARNKLVDCIAEVNLLKDDVSRDKNSLQKVTTKLHNSVIKLNDLDLSKLNKKESVIVKLDSWLIEEDVVEAWKHVGYAEEDLKKSVDILENTHKRRNTKNGKNEVRTLNSVSVPNVIESGIVSLNGSININRNKCCICLERSINAVFYKCGHLCMCFPCATESISVSEGRKCPVCRTKVKEIVRIYLA